MAISRSWPSMFTSLAAVKLMPPQFLPRLPNPLFRQSRLSNPAPGNMTCAASYIKENTDEPRCGVLGCHHQCCGQRRRTGLVVVCTVQECDQKQRQSIISYRSMKEGGCCLLLFQTDTLASFK